MSDSHRHPRCLVVQTCFKRGSNVVQTCRFDCELHPILIFLDQPVPVTLSGSFGIIYWKSSWESGYNEINRHLKLQNSQAYLLVYTILYQQTSLKKLLSPCNNMLLSPWVYHNIITCLIPMTVTTKSGNFQGSQFIYGSGGGALHVTRATWLRSNR